MVTIPWGEEKLQEICTWFLTLSAPEPKFTLFHFEHDLCTSKLVSWGEIKVPPVYLCHKLSVKISFERQKENVTTFYTCVMHYSCKILLHVRYSVKTALICGGKWNQ